MYQQGFRALLPALFKSFATTTPALCSKGVVVAAGTTGTGIVARELVGLSNALGALGALSGPACAEATPTSTSVLANDILQRPSVKKFKLELEEEAENSTFIPFSNFVERARSSCAAESEQDADALCDALTEAGTLLKHSGIVYLRVDEIMNTVAEVIPGSIHDARAKLAKIEVELAELEKHMCHATGRAEVVTTLMLGVGFGILFIQFLAFIYLTWWELSWDVMEPFGYIIGLFYSLLAYAYFLTTRGATFDLAPFRDFWMGRITQSRVYELKLDEDRCVFLQRLRERYRRHIALRAFRL